MEEQRKKKRIKVLAVLLVVVVGAFLGITRLLFSNREPVVMLAPASASILMVTAPTLTTTLWPATVSIPTVTPWPTGTPRPTITPWAPGPTRTPRPTNTPMPSWSGPTEVVVFTGNGDAVLDFDLSKEYSYLHIVGNAAGRYFAIETYDGDNKRIDLLVNTTDPYDGFRPIDLLAGPKVKRILITAVGNWTIEAIPAAPISEFLEHILEVPGAYEGDGDDFIWLHGDPDIMTVKGNAGGRYFGVFGYDKHRRSLLVSTTASYEGNKLLELSTWLLEVQAKGSWTITITER